ncbi:MAG: ATP-binding protein [bacterium]|nr:ATP-binding protein [bacterium]
MRRLVDGLVLYAETCAGTVEPARFAAGAALAESINKLENEMGIAKAAVVAPAPLPHVVASQADLELIFDQLIGNAIVHRGSSPPHINIVAEADGAQVRFAVSDNGPGIAAEYHEFIFEPLKRLQPPEVSGSGLGLAIARRLVLRNGGRLWVESETGRGSSFIFTLPA